MKLHDIAPGTSENVEPAPSAGLSKAGRIPPEASKDLQVPKPGYAHARA
jgi:hypothetical protein